MLIKDLKKFLNSFKDTDEVTCVCWFPIDVANTAEKLDIELDVSQINKTMDRLSVFMESYKKELLYNFLMYEAGGVGVEGKEGTGEVE